MKIIIDAGHGPHTAGKRSPDGSLREFEFNSKVALRVKEQLVSAGHTILFTHQPDLDVPLGERIRLANRLKGEVLVSIHANAFGNSFNTAAGIETYTYTRPLPASRQLAGLIQEQLIQVTRRRDRGVKQADFMILRETVMPAVLVECGFMTNREEMALLKSANYQIACASAISSGLLKFTGQEPISGCCC